MGPYFVRLADTGPVSAGFWRLFLAVPVFVIFAMMQRQQLSLGAPRVMAAVIGAGLFFGFDIASWHIGIELTRMGNATLFGNSGSLVLMVWSFVMLQRLPRGREWLAIVSALAGAAILLGRSFEVSLSTLAGDLFSLFAGLCYAGYLLLLQGARRTLGNWSLLAWSSAASAPVLLVLALAHGEPVWPHNWWPILALVVSSQLLGQGLLVFSLRHFPPLVIGLALLTQPAVASLAGWLAFGEVLGPMDIFGMALLAGALVLARLTERRPPSTAAAGAAS